MSDSTEPQEPEAATEETPEAVETPEKFPDDHPLVKALAAQKEELKALKDKARRLDEIEEASKSEAEKAAERLAAAEKAAADAEAKVLRRDIVIEHGLDKDDAALLEQITDEDTLRSIAARLAVKEPAGPRAPKPDPNQGRSGSRSATNADLFAAAIEQQFTR